jgi:hypothetical protein
MSLAKWAVDSTAKQYWESYYKEYGKSWVRDIPRRVKKAMVENKKVASEQVADAGVVTPVATAILPNGGVALEGMFRGNTDKFVFQAEFDAEGKITSFDVVKLAAEDKQASKSKSKSKSK